MTTASQTHDVINPATEEVVATVPLASLEQADAAIAEAKAAAPGWAAIAPADRALLLRRFSDLVGEHQEELALLEVANAGHTIGNARWEAATSATSSPTTPGRQSGTSGARSRSPAASTSRSGSRWGSSASSCRGTSRCRSPAGGSLPR